MAKVNGTGQVYVEAHGDHFDIRIDLPNGTRSKRHCLASTFDKGEARAEAHRLKAVAWADAGARKDTAEPASSPSAPRETLDDYAERWAASRRDQRETRQHLQHHILPALGALRPLTSITRADVEAFVRQLDDNVMAKRIAWKTAINIFGTCTKLFDDAVNAKKVELRALANRTNPCTDVRGPDRGEHRQSSWLFPREADALLSSAAIPVRWRVLYSLGLYTGLRRGELAVLRVADVVIDAGYITVHKAHDRVTGGTKSTKGKRARRVPIEPELLPLLIAMTKDRKHEELLIDAPPKQKVAEEFRVHLQRVGVTRSELFADDDHRRPITFHDTRHTFATWLALRGESELVIQSRLGHATTDQTQGYIEAAESVGNGNVGAPFGPLPPDLEKAFPNLSKTLQVAESIAGWTGLEPGKTPAIADSCDQKRPVGNAPNTEHVGDHDGPTPTDRGAGDLERALARAAEAGQWSIVELLGRELEARRLAGSNVVPIGSRRRAR